MIKLLTSHKILIASILSKILILFLGNEKKIIKRDNIKYEVDLNEGIDLGIYLNIKNERKLLNIKKILDIKSRLNMVDIGSNIGSVTLPLSGLFRYSTIYAIEPTFYAYNKLIKNIMLNPKLKTRIKPMNYLISKHAKPEMVHSSWGLNYKKQKHKIHLGSLRKINKKNIISLDKLIKRINKKIHFIKIDVDGFEFEVLQSGLFYINKYKPIIHIEFAPYLHQEFGYSSKKLINLIRIKLKYNFYNENLKKITDIDKYILSIKKRSENFFLMPSN